MLNALNRKKKEYEEQIDSYNAEIAKMEANVEQVESKLAIVNEMIAEEEAKSVSAVTETVKIVEAEAAATDDVVLCYR